MSNLNLDDFYFDDDSYIKQELKDIDLSGLTGGKHLRSKLIKLTAGLFNLEDQITQKLGRVVELVHNATLTHDDVVDNSHTRRGSVSVPALINNKKSVLLGDYMLAKALHELSEFDNPKLTGELTLTLKELVEGEWIQYENTNPYEISTHLYETLAIKKTGSLFRWCFLAPLIVFDKNSNIYELYQELGEQLGVIFQMSDDVIDFNKESKKSYGLDFRNNNINYVLHFVGLSHPEVKIKFLQTEEITDLSKAELEIIDQASALAKETIQSKVNNCEKIVNKLKEKLPESEASLDEINSIVKYITARVF